ncbi:conjugal transfer protein TraD [Sphingomonas sp. IC-56]|uniref:conjugal transfer protein TraD n=1 Tax=Sphingomonas sp. IC-56 TaxID=2898529 RepID=UPI002ED92E5B
MGGEATRADAAVDRAWDLTAKVDLVALTEDDRAVIFGILETAALMLRSGDRDQALVSWQRRAKRAFSLVVRTLSVDSFAS